MWPMAILNFSWSMWYVFYYCFFRKIHEIALKERNDFFFLQEKVRKAFPTHTILAGNVVTGDMVEALIFAGADIVKVGIFLHFFCQNLIPFFFHYFSLFFNRLESVRDPYVRLERRLELDIPSYLLFWNVRTMLMDYQLILFR